MKDLSIAIANWNTRDLLAQCLDSVLGSPISCDYEIIVVDNASDDGSADMVESAYTAVKVVRNRVNMGFAAACNLAFKHSSGRYFLLLNTDTIVLDNAMQAMVNFMDTHPDAGASGCRLLNRDHSLQRSCSVFPSPLTELFDALYLSKLFPKNKLFAGFSMSYWDFDEVREVDFAGGSCLIVRREAIEEVGLLDEGYFMYTEEADWCYRLWQQDWKVYFYPGAQIIHLGGESARRYGNNILIRLYTSRNRFIRKHQGVAAATVHRMIVGIGAVIRLFVFGAKKLLGKGEPDAIQFQAKLLRWTLLEPTDQNTAVGQGRSA